MNHIRQQVIQEYIEKNGVVTIRELRELYPDLSLMTIHRDLDALEARNAIVKVRGGAKAVRHAGDPGFQDRLQENTAAKTAITRKALELIRPDSTVFLDASTTNLILARNLPDIRINVFTNAPNIGLELCQRLHNPVVTFCCGTINRRSQAVSGQSTLDMLAKINIDLAFLGVSGCSAEAGFTCGTESEMMVKKRVIEKARTSVVMCDRTKLSRLMPYTFASLGDVDYLISEGELPESLAQAAAAAGLTVL